MDSDSGQFYELRQRLRGSLSRHHWERGKPFSPLQEDAWMLLNEVEQIIKTLDHVSKLFPEDDPREVIQAIRHTLATHQPRWKVRST